MTAYGKKCKSNQIQYLRFFRPALFIINSRFSVNEKEGVGKKFKNFLSIKIRTFLIEISIAFIAYCTQMKSVLTGDSKGAENG